MTNGRTILIIGVTGNQVGAVAPALQGAGVQLRGLTRTPDSQRAAALARQGIDIVKGGLDDEATLRRALAGAWDVFGCRTRGRRASSGKRRRASVLRRGAETGAEHYVYTSVLEWFERVGCGADIAGLEREFRPYSHETS